MVHLFPCASRKTLTTSSSLIVAVVVFVGDGDDSSEGFSITSYPVNGLDYPVTNFSTSSNSFIKVYKEIPCMPYNPVDEYRPVTFPARLLQGQTEPP